MTRGLKKKEIRKTTKKLVSLTSFTRQDERADERNVFCESPLAPLPCVRRMKKKSVRPAWLLAAIKRRRKTFFLSFFFFWCDVLWIVTHCCQLSHTGDHQLVCFSFYSLFPSPSAYLPVGCGLKIFPKISNVGSFCEYLGACLLWRPFDSISIRKTKIKMRSNKWAGGWWWQGFLSFHTQTFFLFCVLSTWFAAHIEFLFFIL